MAFDLAVSYREEFGGEGEGEEGVRTKRCMDGVVAVERSVKSIFSNIGVCTYLSHTFC